RGSQSNRASPAGDRGQPDERRRIERAIVVVLSEPDRIESCRLGPLALPDGLREIAARLKWAQAELHLRRLPVDGDGTPSPVRAGVAVPRWRLPLSVWQAGTLPRRWRGAPRAPSPPVIARYCTIYRPRGGGIGCARGMQGRGARASRGPLPGSHKGGT